MCNFKYYLFEKDGREIPIRFGFSDGQVVGVQYPEEGDLLDRAFILASCRGRPQEIDESTFWEECKKFGVFPPKSNSRSQAGQQPIQASAPSP